MDKNGKIFVAGHRGMVGSALVRKLQETGYQNIVTRTHSELDLTRQSDTEQFIQEEKPDYIFIAAAKVGGILANSTYTAEFIYKNIMIAANLISASHQFGVKKLLNLGSTCIYPKFAPQPMKEEHLLTDSLEPTNEAYAIAKISAIKLCRYFNHQYQTNFLSCMPTNLYGPNDNYNFRNSHVLPAFIRKLHLSKLFQAGDFEGIKADLSQYGSPVNKEVADLTPEDITDLLKDLGITKTDITLWGSGSPYREFLHADDLAEACLFLMEKYDADQIGEFVNVGTGEDMQLKAIAELVKGVVGYQGNILWDTSKPDGTPKKLSDVTRINQLGWKARISLEQGVQLTYDGYLKK